MAKKKKHIETEINKMLEDINYIKLSSYLAYKKAAK